MSRIRAAGRDLFNKVTDRVWHLILAALLLFSTAKILNMAFPRPGGDLSAVTSLLYSSLELTTAIFVFFATAAVTVGIVRFLLTMQDTRNYFEDIFHESVSDLVENRFENKKFVEKLSEDTVDKLHYELVKRSANIDFSFDSTFFQTMRKEIEPLLGKTHFEHLDVHINNFFKEIDGNPYIESVRRIDTTFHTRTTDEFELIKSKIVRQVDGIDKSDLYKLRSIKIGPPEADEDDMEDFEFTMGEPEAIKAREDLKDSYRFTVSIPIKITVEPHDPTGKFLRVIRKETVLLPVNDVIRWTISEGRSLRKLSVYCGFDKKVNPTLWLFGIEKDPTNPKFSGYSKKKPINHAFECYTKEWEGWMLPKHGFVIGWDESN